MADHDCRSTPILITLAAAFRDYARSARESGLIEEDYRALQKILINRPESGDLIKGSGGLRKIRWKLESQGKLGGIRVIYYRVTADDQIRMLYVYRKSKQSDLTPEQLVMLKSIVERW